jgi:hypothetical protein
VAPWDRGEFADVDTAAACHDGAVLGQLDSRIDVFGGDQRVAAQPGVLSGVAAGGSDEDGIALVEQAGAQRVKPALPYRCCLRRADLVFGKTVDENEL